MANRCDCLVIGSGLAALSYALKAASDGRQIIMVTKRGADEANTAHAQGGIAAVLTDEDSFAAHADDTQRAGAGLCRGEAVDLTVSEGPAAIERLLSAGVRFDKEDGGESYDLTREGGHSFRRILHAGDITGREIQRGLLDALDALPNVQLLEHHCAVDLITRRKVEGRRTGPRAGTYSEDRCLGAYVLDEETGEVKTFVASVTLLATGGAGKVYLYTSNPDIATGDGIAMAWRAGADVANMEFIQFHPTCLYHPEAKSFLLSEALRGEGAILRRMDGTQFMQEYHPSKELAPRDVVARAIDTELKRSGADHVLLDLTHLDSEFVKRRFPNIYARCLSFGYDATEVPLPAVPATHYVCGGVRSNLDGETNIPGLFVAGETACTGLHGANRLASNSLLEAAVFGHRAAVASARYLDAEAPDFSEVAEWDVGAAVPSDELVVISQCWDEIRRFMHNYVGIVRSDRRLTRARRRIETIEEEIREFYWNATVTRDLLELRNIAVVAKLIVACALRRKESRGLHYTIDYPKTAANELPQQSILRRDDLV